MDKSQMRDNDHDYRELMTWTPMRANDQDSNESEWSIMQIKIWATIYVKNRAKRLLDIYLKSHLKC